MVKKELFKLQSLYRDDLRVTGYEFGHGNKSACILGGMRGNEVQQVYICSQIVQELKKLESSGAIAKDCSIMVMPSVNSYSLNIESRFWPVDHTDINRMFPGYDLGETTQRIAAGVFEAIKDYKYGIQFPSFYLPGDFVPHVRMMDTGFQDVNLASDFGLPYVVVKKPKPYDTTTLNYNWQLWGTHAYSVYTSACNEVQEETARQAVGSVLRFLAKQGIIKYKGHSGYISSVVASNELVTVKTNVAGIYLPKVGYDTQVEKGQVLATILNPNDGEKLEDIISPVDGVVFFAYHNSMIYSNTVAYRLIGDTHK